MKPRGSDVVRAQPERLVNTSEIERHPEQHHDKDAGGNGRAFEVPDLSGRMVGEGSRRHVESREPADAADHEVRQAQHVPTAAQSERKAQHRRRHAKRDDIGQRIEVAAERGLARRRRAGDDAVEDVADERQRKRRNAIQRNRLLPVAT